MMADKVTSRGALFLAARLLAVAFMLLCWGIFVVSVVEYPKAAAAVPAKFTLAAFTPAQMDSVMGQIGLSYQVWLQWSRLSSIAFAAFFSLVGIFLFLRKSNDWFGLYLAVTFVLYGTLSGSASTVITTLHPKLELLAAPLGVLAWVSLFIIIFLFPNGRFVPGWTRLVVLGIILIFIFDIVVYHGNQPPVYIFVPLFTLIMIGPASQVYRYRKVSNPIERQQTKLVMLSMVFVFTILFISGIPYMFGLDLNPAARLSLFFALFDGVGAYSVGLIPLSIALAIFRYRLWDIDLVIRRTLMYTGLTATLGLVYFGCVVLFQQVLGPLTGNSTLAIVLSTLLIAALFEPARRRIQSFVDRRFYRQKYDASLALEEFSDAARHEVELKSLTTHMVTVVEKTVQPEQVSVWLRDRRAR
jgi:hypothetical protein